MALSAPSSETQVEGWLNVGWAWYQVLLAVPEASTCLCLGDFGNPKEFR